MNGVKYTKFKAWMNENNVTGQDLADLLGVSKSTISKKLNGLSDFSLAEIRIICAEYNISSDVYFIAYKVS